MVRDDAKKTKLTGILRLIDLVTTHLARNFFASLEKQGNGRKEIARM